MIATLLLPLCIISALVLGLGCAWSDIKGLRIPNSYSVAIIGLFALAYSLDVYDQTGLFYNFKNHLLGAGVMFAITAILYALKLLGAGDSKMATAFALWTGLSALPAFLFYMTICGGLLGLGAYIIQKTGLFKACSGKHWISKLHSGKNALPYGIAIAFGAVAGFIKAGYLDFVIM